MAEPAIKEEELLDEEEEQQEYVPGQGPQTLTEEPVTLRLYEVKEEKEEREARLKREKRIRIFLRLIPFAAILVLIIAFLFAFELKEFQTEGSTYYTSEDVEKLLCTKKTDSNAFLLYMRLRYFDKPSLPFAEEIHVSLKDRHTVLLTMYEKDIVGCFSYMGEYVCFDQDGIMVGSILNERADVPLIEGIKVYGVTYNEKIATDSTTIFKVILNITQLLKKYELPVTRITFDESQKVTLHYQGIDILLGRHNVYDEPISALPDILSKAGKLSGTLYMEEYGGTNRDVIFEYDKIVTEDALAESETGEEGGTENTIVNPLEEEGKVWGLGKNQKIDENGELVTMTSPDEEGDEFAGDNDYEEFSDGDELDEAFGGDDADYSGYEDEGNLGYGYGTYGREGNDDGGYDYDASVSDENEDYYNDSYDEDTSYEEDESYDSDDSYDESYDDSYDESYDENYDDSYNDEEDYYSDEYDDSYSEDEYYGDNDESYDSDDYYDEDESYDEYDESYDDDSYDDN